MRLCLHILPRTLLSFVVDLVDQRSDSFYVNSHVIFVLENNSWLSECPNAWAGSGQYNSTPLESCALREEGDDFGNVEYKLAIIK